MAGKHNVDVKKVGSVNSGSMTPYCSCGWTGSTWSNKHPNQFQCVTDEMKAHTDSFKKPKSNDERPVISFDNVLKQRKIEGKSFVLIQPSSANVEVISALKKLLPNEKQDCVVLVDLTQENL
ncbi:hypothetical protein [Pseudoalteromonas luteoviolacea]|uniref:Uncharacterized protein n=1 Tax=Pseudoalteromonas luteoviolacea S4060-1 TaxID=1365257 RepID=A0A167KV85_9GAMM|nr:hypothetical protein [Pseudoalteromonas luteoviolacea]KZN63335.1 hypothetical protein N478_03535 [Pseudoalteromonas luteoviolacea S4060-1]